MTHLHLDVRTALGVEHLGIARAWFVDQAVEMMHSSAKHRPEWYYRIRRCAEADCEPVNGPGEPVNGGRASESAQESDETEPGRGRTPLRLE